MLIGAIVLAAGEGKRFGGNKLLIKINNKFIIQYVLEALEDLERVIVVGKYAEDFIKILNNEIIVYNPYWKYGMSSSIKLGLRFFLNYDGVIIALGDMPLITRELIKNLVNNYSVECLAIVPKYKEVLGNPVLISKKIFHKLNELSGDIGARVIIRNLKEGLCYIDADESVTIDVDKPEDLVLVSQKLASRLR
jgi:molybdenum cofactor cytidylyltransferase